MVNSYTIFTQEEVIGIPTSEEYESFHPDLREHFKFPGRWRSDSKIEVAKRWPCKMNGPGNGIYLIDIGTLFAEKGGELPVE